MIEYVVSYNLINKLMIISILLYEFSKIYMNKRRLNETLLTAAYDDDLQGVIDAINAGADDFDDAFNQAALQGNFDIVYYLLTQIENLDQDFHLIGNVLDTVHDRYITDPRRYKSTYFLLKDTFNKIIRQ